MCAGSQVRNHSPSRILHSRYTLTFSPAISETSTPFIVNVHTTGNSWTFSLNGNVDDFTTRFVRDACNTNQTRGLRSCNMKMPLKLATLHINSIANYKSQCPSETAQQIGDTQIILALRVRKWIRVLVVALDPTARGLWGLGRHLINRNY